MIVYQNKNYKVETNEDGIGYSIINLVTGMVEYKEGMLAIAINTAMNMDKDVEKVAEIQAAQDRTVMVPSNEILVPKH